MRIWFPVLIVAGLLVWQLGDFDNSSQPPPAHAAAASSGYPQSIAAGPVSVFENHGFVVGYSEQRRDPLWVAFSLRPVSSGRLPPRPRFERDPRSQAGVNYRDLTGSGFDRGHMAPNYSMAKLYGVEAQRQSFLMTNVVPQRPRLNQLLWQRLEEAEIDNMASRWRELWVTTGPVFDDDRETLSSGVEIPDMFYRLWLDETEDGELRALALLVPQNVRGDEPLSDFLTTVDHIEALTGLDFYPQLPESEQERLESVRADLQAWEFAAIACQPARYGDNWQGKNGIRLQFDRCH